MSAIVIALGGYREEERGRRRSTIEEEALATQQNNNKRSTRRTRGSQQTEQQDALVLARHSKTQNKLNSAAHLAGRIAFLLACMYVGF